MTTDANAPVRVVVVGAGPAAMAMHLPVLAQLRDKGEIVLVLVCDIQRDRAAEARRKFGFLQDSGDGIASLSRGDIDAAYIFGSAQLHYEYGLVALRNGKHLFVEKPVAPSYAQAREMASAARALGLIAVGGLNRRFFESFDAVRARAGKVRWRYAEAIFHKPEFGKPPLFGARTWLGANGIHGLDALIYMMDGLPVSLTALAGDAGAAEPSAFSALLRWADGSQGVFLCNNNSGARREEYTFHGLGETCTVTGKELIVERDGRRTATPFDSLGDGVAAEHESFVHAIRSGERQRHSLDALAPSLFLGELIEAGFSGRVELPAESFLNVERPRKSAARSILVTNSADLQPALARWLPRTRLVSVEDVKESDVARPDVMAAILGRGSAPLSEDVLNKLPNLCVVGVAALSLERYAPDILLARGVRLFNASVAYADSVAEFALGLAILGRRRAFISHELMRVGGWGTQPRAPGMRGMLQRLGQGVRPTLRNVGVERFFLDAWKVAGPPAAIPGLRPVEARDLQGALVGLIGWGANARAFAERLTKAKARVIVYSEHAADGEIQSAGAAVAALNEVLAADIVSLHRGLTADTRHFLGAAELARLRPGSVLINVARGALIEPAALLSRLRRRDIFACLDTFEYEPPETFHPLRKLSNVFLTSHIAGGSRDMLAAAAEEVVRRVANYLDGEAPEGILATRLRTMT